ncbi:high-affinity Zn(2+) transporter zrt1 [Vermiconidia calcicola]|uniref:High-affinity Zn(2+) transporter zrt1 n=1 Tax=Vermiconidia calcicola TaxID=1690605 RepID=A0ACC3MEW7_9PEZI|nr:high-affinity Zn(2+) transporter zrt1 [Vermiconidia calcicola]
MAPKRISALAALLIIAGAKTAEEITEVTDCHLHDETQFCFAGDAEWEVTTMIDTADAPESYSNCHAHGEDGLHCTGGNLEVTLAAATAESEEDHAHETSTTTSEEITEVTSCHLHGDTQYCFAGDEEYEVVDGPDAASAPDHYDDCHAHEEELHCTGDGLDMTLAAAATDEHTSEGATESEGEGEAGTESAQEGVSCHFHAGVEHRVDAEGNTVESGCARPEYEYNVPLRVGLRFVLLATSALGVFIPVFTERFSSIKTDNAIFIGLRQFGTGIIISTALVHLFTHAQIDFSNECLGRIRYEATTAAIAMAGLFITFAMEYIAHRFVVGRRSTGAPASPMGSDKPTHSDGEASSDAVVDGRSLILNTLSWRLASSSIPFVMLGVVLVVANDSAFITLFVVIIFHQMFEGVALGTRIAIMPAALSEKLS